MRFVSTPAVLERFVSIEKEIVQIEVSIHANESSNTDEPGQLDQGVLSLKILFAKFALVLKLFSLFIIDRCTYQKLKF